MSIDFDAIAEALATLYLSTTPPSGEEAISLSTADIPDSISNERTLLVLPPLDPEWEYGPGLRRTTLQYPVRFFLWQTRDKPRATKLLRRWATALYARTDASVHLGLSAYVTWAAIDTGPTLAVLRHDGTDYVGLDALVGVRVWEPLSLTA